MRTTTARNAVALAVIGAVVQFGLAAQANAADKEPNIVFILADNLCYGELGAYGGGLTRGAATPRIDSLAKEGMRFLNMNMETQCTPSRSSLMTGRWAIRSGTHSVIASSTTPPIWGNATRRPPSSRSYPMPPQPIATN